MTTKKSASADASLAPEKWGAELADTETRRNFIMLLAMPGEAEEWTKIPDMAEIGDIAMLSVAVRALAREVMHLGLDLVEAQERLDTAEVGGHAVGAFLGGALGLDEPEHEPEDNQTVDDLTDLDDAAQVRRFHLIAHRTGSTIRKSAGLGPLKASS